MSDTYQMLQQQHLIWSNPKGFQMLFQEPKNGSCTEAHLCQRGSTSVSMCSISGPLKYRSSSAAYSEIKHRIQLTGCLFETGRSRRDYADGTKNKSHVLFIKTRIRRKCSIMSDLWRRILSTIYEPIDHRDSNHPYPLLRFHGAKTPKKGICVGSRRQILRWEKRIKKKKTNKNYSHLFPHPRVSLKPR